MNNETGISGLQFWPDVMAKQWTLMLLHLVLKMLAERTSTMKMKRFKPKIPVEVHPVRRPAGKRLVLRKSVKRNKFVICLYLYSLYSSAYYISSSPVFSEPG
jgi:hypothetical protein